MSVTIHFDDQKLETVNTDFELVELLNRILTDFEPDNPVLRLVHSNENSLEVGISRIGCFANFKMGSLEPPYYSTVGDSERKGIVKFQMSNKGHVTEIPSRNIISWEDLIVITEEFFVSGSLPSSNVEWEVD